MSLGSETGRGGEQLAAPAFDAAAFLRFALRRWYLIFLGLAIGGAAGLFAAALTPPLYESRASLLVVVDYGNAQASQDLTIYQSLDRVRALLLADDTLDAARQASEGVLDNTELGGSLLDVRKHIRVAQTPSGFDLYTYVRDPVLGAAFTNSWANVSLQELEQAYLHAIKTSALQHALYASHCELRLVGEGAEQRVLWICASEDVDPAASQLPERLLEEVRLSRGILPFLSFSLLEQALPANTPVLWNRGMFALAGLLAGLIVVLLVLGVRAYRQPPKEG